MDIFNIPTGFLIVDEYENGRLETLSIRDYGKKKNVKADFLGYTQEINGVPCGSTQPFEEKWVVTLSTQYGCQLSCTFCDVPKIPFKGNVSFNDLKRQFFTALKIGGSQYTDRLNLHFARMGEPVFNPDVLQFAKFLIESKREIQEETGVRIETLHPVLTTMCPSACKNIKEVLYNWCRIKNDLYHGQAGLQLSINTTDEQTRRKIFRGKAISLSDLSVLTRDLPNPVARKYCLNFALITGTEINGDKLSQYFDPRKWMVKITPIHNNQACRKNDIQTENGYSSFASYREVERSCKNAGFDTLIFIPSQEEEDSLITCGNAILSGSQLTV